MAYKSSSACTHWPKWFVATCQRFTQILKEGDPDLYLTGYAWHNRFTYSEEKIKSYNESALGGGYGQEIYDERGNLHGLYGILFLESHKKLEPALGYTFLKVFSINEHWKWGAGYTVLATMREDINHNIPFPGLLPWVSLSYQHASLLATYIPGGRNTGNVLFLLIKWRFNHI